MCRLLTILFALFLVSCGLSPQATRPKKSLDVQAEKNRIFLELVRLTDKLAPYASFENRDSSAFDGYYKQRLSIHDFANYYITDSVRYFQLYRIAPSLFQEKIAIAGKYRTGKKGEILDFEEVYITKKLKPEELESTADQLFLELIQKGNVDDQLKNKKLIDFPDEVNSYSVEQRRWVLNIRH